MPCARFTGCPSSRVSHRPPGRPFWMKRSQPDDATGLRSPMEACAKSLATGTCRPGRPKAEPGPIGISTSTSLCCKANRPRLKAGATPNFWPAPSPTPHFAEVSHRRGDWRRRRSHTPTFFPGRRRRTGDAVTLVHRVLAGARMTSEPGDAVRSFYRMPVIARFTPAARLTLLDKTESAGRRDGIALSDGGLCEKPSNRHLSSRTAEGRAGTHWHLYEYITVL